ncbi:DUF1284 domain-containing protein [Terriglobus saanensis]|uniref:DUF1284 domain-containing protein n=1 Tax=Terriglobus saanensis (strain ATCC BAA-1853 / DSM 23119 / SP1PR4) TaxID=401053 RepID=E8V097_TERSS|nr:DUF1284 domain-containing protein [Terriglobus saanensis]ADV83315.1 protein of unknown function DUF1284 [Terriglobus saanensis SP1PR4]
MTIKLRAHHLLCMLTFVGEGYTPAFVSNFEEVIWSIKRGEALVKIVQGPDDLCSPLFKEAVCHCHDPSVLLRDERAAADLGVLLELAIGPGESLLLTEDVLQTLRRSFADGTIRSACLDCQWKPLCDTVAERSFHGTRLLQ